MRTPLETRRFIRRTALSGILLLALLAPSRAAASGADARGFWFSTENDLLRGDGLRDDLYTYSVALEVAHGPWAWALREDAFTDREAGLRFDESSLTLGRGFLAPDGWHLELGLGVAHVGRGLLGEGTQNVVHRLIGADEVELAYRGSSFHPRIELRAVRARAIGARFDVGPILDVEAVPGVRALAALGARARWAPTPRLAVHAELGGRYSRAESAPLEPHLDGLAAAARLALVYDDRYLVSWSYNDRGDERQHLSVGYLIPFSDRRAAPRDD